MHNTDFTYFDFFGVEHIPKEIKAFIDRSLSITTNIFRIQAYDSIMCGYFCIGFIDFMLAGKTLTKFTNLFSPNNFKKKWWYISKIFYDKYLKMTECNCIDHSFHETTNMYPSDQQHFRLNFVADIKERELMNKRLSKYIASFDYFDKSLIVFSVITFILSNHF